MAEIPTIWLDRSFGVSNFKLLTWLPHYLHWYFYALGIDVGTPSTYDRRSTDRRDADGNQVEIRPEDRFPGGRRKDDP